MAKTLTLEGDITAVDTATALTTQGSVSAPSVIVPVGVTKIDKIIVAVAADLAVAGSASYLLRIRGNAPQGGEQTITIGASGGQTPQAGSDQAPQVHSVVILENVDIAVVHDTIALFAEMMGTDLGTARIVVTLYFA